MIRTKQLIKLNTGAKEIQQVKTPVGLTTAKASGPYNLISSLSRNRHRV